MTGLAVGLRRVGLAALLVAAIAAGACSRAESGAAGRGGAQDRATTGRQTAEVEAPGPDRTPDVIERPEGEPPIATSPQIMLRRDGVRALQMALVERGYRVPLNGRFEQQTRLALLAFQSDEGLAETSMPDLATLERLGLDAQRMYEDL